VQAGVKHIVFLSVMGAGTNTRIPHHGIELAINACAAKGVTHTHLRVSASGEMLRMPVGSHTGAITPLWGLASRRRASSRRTWRPHTTLPTSAITIR